MYDSYIIETRNGAAGIVVRDGTRFRFFAATTAFSDLEGQLFNTPKVAEAAAVRHIDPKRPKLPDSFDLALQWSS